MYQETHYCFLQRRYVKLGQSLVVSLWVLLAKRQMNSQTITNASSAEEQVEQVASYEAPAIESVLTPESLEREVHYAGTLPTSGPTPPPAT